MANDVYANGRDVSCKAAEGKSICAFPDVCLSPPSPPAGPVPIPYPNTGMATDTTNGSKTVKVGGQEVMLKDKSSFKKSTGDEAATKALGMGVVTHQIQGKVYFTSWSMDVVIEGENVVRHMDQMTHNHASVPGNTAVWPYLDSMAVSDPDHPCVEDQIKEMEACKDCTPYGSQDPCTQLMPGKPSGKMSSPQAQTTAVIASADACLTARRCMLQPYKPNQCCPQQTGHHLIEASSLHSVGRGKPPSVPVQGMHDYDEDKAPCVCAEGVNQHTGTHGQMHTFQSAGVAGAPTETIPLTTGSVTAPAQTYAEAKDNAVSAMKKTFPEADCNPECIKKQLDNYHNQCGVNDSTKIKAVATGQTDVPAAEAAVVDRVHTAYLAGQA